MGAPRAAEITATTDEVVDEMRRIDNHLVELAIARVLHRKTALALDETSTTLDALTSETGADPDPQP